MKRALQHLLSTHFATPAAKASGARPPSKDTLDLVVESAHGDIRSAVMALQFACTAPAAAKGNAKLKRGGERALLAAVTRREQSLALFHLVGKVLYNKRASWRVYLWGGVLMHTMQGRAILRLRPCPRAMRRRSGIWTRSLKTRRTSRRIFRSKSGGRVEWTST